MTDEGALPSTQDQRQRSVENTGRRSEGRGHCMPVPTPTTAVRKDRIVGTVHLHKRAAPSQHRPPRATARMPMAKNALPPLTKMTRKATLLPLHVAS